MSNKNIRAMTEHLVLQVHTAGMQASATRDSELQALLRAQHDIPQSSVAQSLKFIQNTSRNDRFFGRADVLSDLRRRLHDAGHRQASVALHGPPGVGKSQIAIEYLYRHYEYYPVIIWLDSNDHVSLETQFIQLARQIGSMPDGCNHRAEVGAWIAELKCEWLMIFDNADDVEEIRPYWPASVRGSILLTSRNPTSCEEGLAQASIPIEPFTSEEGVEFVEALLGRQASFDQSTRLAVLELSQAFDGLPLALKIAVSTMKCRNYTPSQLTRILVSSMHEVEQQGISSRVGTKSLATVFNMVLESLEPASLDLLDVIAFLDPKNIAVELFEPSHYDEAPNSNFRNGAQGLWAQSLLRFSDEKTIMEVHGYTHSFVYRRLLELPDRHDYALRMALELLDDVIPDLILSPNRSPDLWPRREKYLVHVRSLERVAVKSMPQDCVFRLIKLLTSYGYYFYEVGTYTLGHEILRAAISLIERYEVDDIKILSQLEFTKGKLYNEENEPITAERHWREALRICYPNTQNENSASTESDHEFLCMIYSGLGTSLTAQNRFEEAERYHRQAILQVERLTDQTPKRLGTLYTNLGSCLLWAGFYEEAEEILHTALLKHDRLLECTLYALGNVYLFQNRIADALNQHTEVLEIFSKTLGHTHHCTADSCIKVGTLLANGTNEQNDLEQAQRFIQKGLDIFIYWSNHGQTTQMKPYIARGKWKLATILERHQDSQENEILQLKSEAKALYHDITGGSLPVSDILSTEALDSVVFYWSR